MQGAGNEGGLCQRGLLPQDAREPKEKTHQFSISGNVENRDVLSRTQLPGGSSQNQGQGQRETWFPLLESFPSDCGHRPQLKKKV